MMLAPWHTPAIIDNVEAQLNRAFMEIIFRPVIAEIKKATRQGKVLERLNGAMDPLHEALRTGQVQFDTTSGEFSGQFSAAVSRPLEQIGARFDRRRKVYRIRPERVPAWVLAEANIYKVTAQQAHNALKKILNQVQTNLDELAEKFAVDPSKVAQGVEAGYRAVARAIGINADLMPAAKAKLAREYAENLKLHIRDFSAKMVGQLRQVVEDNATGGHRFDRLIEKIEGRYEVTRSKAAFLARNETALFMATHREARFSEVGITEYYWSTSHDERVRHDPDGPDHRYLEGKRFSYADPPVVDHKTGRRANPGKDYNCRCVDKPVLPAVKKRMEAAA